MLKHPYRREDRASLQEPKVAEAVGLSTLAAEVVLAGRISHGQ